TNFLCDLLEFVGLPARAMAPQYQAISFGRVLLEEPLCRGNEAVGITGVEGPELLLTIDQTWVSHDVASRSCLAVVESAVYDIGRAAYAENLHQAVLAKLVEIVVGRNVSKYCPLGFGCHGSFSPSVNRCWNASRAAPRVGRSGVQPKHGNPPLPT